MSIEMSSHKLVDLRLGRCVQILELVHCLELDDIEAIGQNAIRFALE